MKTAALGAPAALIVRLKVPLVVASSVGITHCVSRAAALARLIQEA